MTHSISSLKEKFRVQLAIDHCSTVCKCTRSSFLHPIVEVLQYPKHVRLVTEIRPISITRAIASKVKERKWLSEEQNDEHHSAICQFRVMFCRFTRPSSSR